MSSKYTILHCPVNETAAFEHDQILGDSPLQIDTKKLDGWMDGWMAGWLDGTDFFEHTPVPSGLYTRATRGQGLAPLGMIFLLPSSVLVSPPRKDPKD